MRFGEEGTYGAITDINVKKSVAMESHRRAYECDLVVHTIYFHTA